MENLLPGVELVEEYTSWKVSIFGAFALCICVIGIIMLFATIFAISLDAVKVKNPVNRAVLISISAILFFVGWGGSLYDEKTHSIPRYKVTISDEVSMREFLTHYDIIDQDGEILIVEENENSGDTN